MTRGGEQTISPQEFSKIESEQRIRNSNSFYELLTTLEDLKSITGSDGKTEFTYDELITRMANLFEQFNKKEALRINLLTSNLGLRETFTRLMNEYSSQEQKLVADQFLVRSGDDTLPIKNFPVTTEDWFKKDGGETILGCTIMGVKDLARDKYQRYYGSSPRVGYLKYILKAIQYVQREERKAS